MGAKITAIEYYLPTQVFDNEELEKRFPEWPADKVLEKIGIKQRPVTSENETALDLAVEASKLLFKNFDKDKIDFILFCTQSPDYFLPTTACIFQDVIGLKKTVGALDFNLGCSGYIYGLGLAKGLISSKIAKNVLLITSETYSKHIHPLDKANISIFGDGAAATVVSASENDKILEFSFGTDGSGKNNLIIHNGGMRNKVDHQNINCTDPDGNFMSRNHLFMNGPEIFNFTIANIPNLVADTLAKNLTDLEKIDYVIFHQANKYMLEYLRKKMKIAPEKFYINMENTGNTVSATIPIAIKDAMNKGRIQIGQKILLVGFGVGYSYGATIIEL